jgi:Tfp pilus assembly protein PilN
VRPVNLLPARYRPRTAGADGSKPTYIALGVLALLLVAVFGYVTAANKVNSTNSEIAQTRQQIAAAESRAVTLKGFGDFATVKETRLAAVRSLATERLDWERLFRELAHVLPEGVWLTSFDGQVAAAEGATDASQTLLLNGCARSHAQIADVMVRLRELHVAEDVELTKTLAAENGGAASAPGSAGSSDTDCGPDYSFEVSVTMSLPTPTVESDSAVVPARLGGGS